MVGWVNDMFAGNQTKGIYVDPNDATTIDTPRRTGRRGSAAQLVDEALPVEPLASVRAARERFLHVRADVRRRIGGYRPLYGFDGRMTP
jgi:hypothetical protein